MLAVADESAGPSDWEKKQQEEALALQKAQFEFEKTKWEYDKEKAERIEYELQFPSRFDVRRVIPTYEFTGYVSDTERQELQKIFTILLEEGINHVRINISSFGGSAFDGLGIADLIESYTSKGLVVIGYGYGKIASAAVPVFAACSKRIAGASMLFMVHEASLFKFFTSESKSDIEAQKRMMDEMEGRYINLLVKHSKKDADHWKSCIQKETWFTSKTAKEWGLVDEIE
jgi:ATP-dependent protease ClpP protease subunit